jgi:hypothetical protein
MGGVIRRSRDVVSAFTDPAHLLMQKAQYPSGHRFKELSALEEVDLMYYPVYVFIGVPVKDFATWVREVFSKSIFATILRKIVNYTIVLLIVLAVLALLRDQLTCAACNRCQAETKGGKLCNVIEVDSRPALCTHEGA